MPIMYQTLYWNIYIYHIETYNKTVIYVIHEVTEGHKKYLMIMQVGGFEPGFFNSKAQSASLICH